MRIRKKCRNVGREYNPPCFASRAMTLNVQEAATLLGVSSDTLRRWARQGLLGMRLPSGDLQFRKPELERWAREHGLRLRAPATARAATSVTDELPLLSAMRRGGFVPRVTGADRFEALADLVRQAPLAGEVDRAQLLEQLVSRERLSSTGLGHGVALPHPRTPSAAFARESAVVVGFLERALDWEAVDQQPVHSVMLLLSPAPAAHLKVLSRVAFLLRDDGFCQMLAEHAGEDLVLAKVEELEPRQG